MEIPKSMDALLTQASKLRDTHNKLSEADERNGRPVEPSFLFLFLFNSVVD